MIESTTPNGIRKYDLKWEEDDIIEILSEFDSGNGNGFQFEGLVKIRYDDNVNPYHTIFTKQFGFDPFFVLPEIPSSLESIDFGLFQWQSFHNITSYEVFDNINATEAIDGFHMMYTYSEDYLPITARIEDIPSENGAAKQLRWSYLED